MATDASLVIRTPIPTMCVFHEQSFYHTQQINRLYVIKTCILFPSLQLLNGNLVRARNQGIRIGQADSCNVQEMIKK